MNLFVQKRPQGPVREATRQEVCQHWMIRRPVSCGGERLYKCSFCGKSEWRKMDPGESICR